MKLYCLARETILFRARFVNISKTKCIVFLNRQTVLTQVLNSFNSWTLVYPDFEKCELAKKFFFGRFVKQRRRDTVFLVFRNPDRKDVCARSVRQAKQETCPSTFLKEFKRCATNGEIHLPLFKSNRDCQITTVIVEYNK